MKWKPPANQTKFNLTRHKQRLQQKPQVVSSLPPVVPTVTIPFEFGLGWDDAPGGVYEDASTIKHTHELNEALDADVDLRTTANFPDVYDQGYLGSCTANALAFCYQFDMLKQGLSFGPNKLLIPSRLFIYYYERVIEGSINFDAGVRKLHNGIEALKKYGVCSETDWLYYDTTDNYDTSGKNTNTKYKEEPPYLDAGKNAETHKALLDNNPLLDIQLTPLHNTVDNLKINLIKGFPIAFGFKAYQSFFNAQITAKNPTMPIPANGEKKVGGHAVVLVGFKEKEKVFIVRNSWGKGWGDSGYFYMPYKIIEAVYIDTEDNNKEKPLYVNDFWSITEVS
jgi:C1A family cysteine protease